MNNYLLMVFFGLLGLVCFLLPKLIYVLYKEITCLGSEALAKQGSAPATQLNTIRIVGLGILIVVGWLLF